MTEAKPEFDKLASRVWGRELHARENAVFVFVRR